MLVAHSSKCPNMVLRLGMVMMLLLSVRMLCAWLLKLVRHAHLHIPLVSLRAIHHHMLLVLLVSLAEHAVRVV